MKSLEHPFICPAEDILKLLAGKWKPQILGLANSAPVRFNTLLRQLPGASKQSLAVALKDLEEAGMLEKRIVSIKPLHVEYTLSSMGKAVMPVFNQLSQLAYAGDASTRK